MCSSDSHLPFYKSFPLMVLVQVFCVSSAIVKSNFLFIHNKNIMLHMLYNSITTVPTFEGFSLHDQLYVVLHPYSFQGWIQLESSLPSIILASLQNLPFINTIQQ
jgi:hypothetical protein